MSHTPAPWTYDDRRSMVDSPNVESFICDAVVTEADGRLIAAAPTLLAALEAFADVRFHLFGDPYVEDIDAFAKKAEAAIRTAIGDEAFEAKYPGSAKDPDEPEEAA